VGHCIEWLEYLYESIDQHIFHAWNRRASEIQETFRSCLCNGCLACQEGKDWWATSSPPISITYNSYSSHLHSVTITYLYICGKLLGQQISQGNIFYLLNIVDKYDCKQLTAQCSTFVVSNFALILAENKKRVMSLPMET